MDEEQAAPDRAAFRNPSRQFRSIGMAGIVVDGTDGCSDFDLVALDAHGPGPVDEKPAERSLGLKADQ